MDQELNSTFYSPLQPFKGYICYIGLNEDSKTNKDYKMIENMNVVLCWTIPIIQLVDHFLRFKLHLFAFFSSGVAGGCRELQLQSFRNF